MNIFAIYMSLVSFSCILGVTVLSLTQYLVIHHMTVADWLKGFPLSMGACLFFVVLIAIMSYVLLKPIMEIIKKAEKEPLTQEEKLSFLPAFKRLSRATTVFLIIAFMVANSAVALIKAANGSIYIGETPFEKFQTQAMFIVLAMMYGFVAIVYCTTYFELFAQQRIKKLGITDIPDTQKPKQFTLHLGLAIFLSSCFVIWNVACVGYGMVRFPEKHFTIVDFTKTGLIMGFWALAFTQPIIAYYLMDLRKRLRRTSTKLRDLRESGDIKQRLVISSIDDFGKINSELNGLMEFLSGVVTNIATNNTSVRNQAIELQQNAENSMVGIKQIVSEFDDINAKSANRDNLLRLAKENIDKLSDESHQISDSITQQSAAIEENAASVTEIVANISSISEMVIKAQSIANQLAEASQAGEKEVKSTIDVIASIEQKSSEMTDIVKVIQSISSETNLLAMNAAIEAAHAGVYGQGFAVVADEIRSLAETTNKSTKEIKGRIEEIIELIETSSASIESTATSFNQISSGISNQLQMVQSISNAMEEQSIGAAETLKVTNEISGEMSGISFLVNRQATHAEDVRTGIDEVVTISKDVDDSLNESVMVVKEFEKSLNVIEISSEQNRKAVDLVQAEVDKFKS